MDPDASTKASWRSKAAKAFSDLNFLSFGTRHMRQNNSMRPNALLKNDIRLPFALTASADISQTVKSKRSRLQSCSSKTALPLSRHSRV
jgi:hypothetical protein